MILDFHVNKQKLIRADTEQPAAQSMQYLVCRFIFSSEDWANMEKHAVFKRYLGGNSDAYTVPLNNEGDAIVPAEVITAKGFEVSVYGYNDGQRITTNKIYVPVHETGYEQGGTPSTPAPALYEQLLDAMKKQVNGLSYESGYMQLMAGDMAIGEKIRVSGEAGGREVEFTNDGTYIKWRYTDSNDWRDLVSLQAITGPQGPPGVTPEFEIRSGHLIAKYNE
ncbi:hypothetical protein [Lacrimispora sp.]|uniref:hypothetical protein n=1 Tax=Lacrimispora sp. TaxID=2719234 RepID=UPI0039953883